jgi:hypothetical protein
MEIVSSAMAEVVDNRLLHESDGLILLLIRIGFSWT